MGHLENHHRHGAIDRSWIEDGSQAVMAGTDGNHVMRLNIPAGETVGQVGMRTFEYTFEPGTPIPSCGRSRQPSR